MESRIWLKSEDKRAQFLVLRGHEVHHLKVAGSMITLKGKVKKVRLIHVDIHSYGLGILRSKLYSRKICHCDLLSLRERAI